MVCVYFVKRTSTFNVTCDYICWNNSPLHSFPIRCHLQKGKGKQQCSASFNKLLYHIDSYWAWIYIIFQISKLQPIFIFQTNFFGDATRTSVHMSDMHLWVSSTSLKIIIICIQQLFSTSLQVVFCLLLFGGNLQTSPMSTWSECQQSLVWGSKFAVSKNGTNFRILTHKLKSHFVLGTLSNLQKSCTY